MNTNPSLGTGFAGVLAQAVAAGIIASSRGSARAACAPLRNVRLGIAFFVINITLSPLCSIYSLQMIHSFERSAFETEHSSRFRELTTRNGIRLSRRRARSCERQARRSTRRLVQARTSKGSRSELTQTVRDG